MRHSGRLELTWTNKARRLHTTPEGGYEWVDPTDPRVTEVRLIDEVATVGEPDASNPNLVIQGDALHALTALNRIPALAAQFAGKVRLVYIDPPFNTGQAFTSYDDNLEHSVWLSMLRDRLEQVRPLLAPNGSVWVHLDDAEVHRCRCVMDEVLGASNFVSSIVWQKRTSRDNRAAFSSQHDHVLVYAARAPGSRWAVKPSVEDPSRSGATFDHRWDETTYLHFRARMNEYRAKVEEAYNEPDKDRSVELWQDIFGEGFKAPEPTSASGRFGPVAASPTGRLGRAG